MNKFVVIGDCHIPFQDKSAIKAFFRFIKKEQPDTVVLNGDIIDMYDVSTFDKDPERINSLQGELDEAIVFFKGLRKLLPDAKLIFIKGNHCARLEKYLKKHPELFSLDALKLPNLLRLKDFDIEYCDKYYQLGSLKITHGSIVRKFAGYTAHAELDKNDCSGISGHTHRLAVYYKKTPSRSLMWAESGCLCELEPEYVDNPDWTQGFIYGTIHKDSFSIMPVPIVDGKIKCPLWED